MESSPERLATLCGGYRETFWMRRNARENNFERYCLAIFRPGTCFWQAQAAQPQTNRRCAMVPEGQSESEYERQTHPVTSYFRLVTSHIRPVTSHIRPVTSQHYYYYPTCT